MGDFELFAVFGVELAGRDDNLMLDKCGCHEENFLSSDLEYFPFDIEKIKENNASSF